MKRFLLIATAVCLTLLGCSQKTTVTGLATDYMECPLGIDVTQPEFSWQMATNRYGAAQAAYQLVVKKGDEVVYDTGRIESDNSVGIAYGGEPLEACTSYDWTVTVWDENGGQAGASSWFETGLMESHDRSVWSDARWIGSSHPHLSRYRSRFTFDFDMKLAEDSEHCVFVFGQSDPDNMAIVDYDISRFPAELVFSYVKDGEKIEADRIAIPFINRRNCRDSHHLSLEVLAHRYAMGFRIKAKVDGISLAGNWSEAKPYEYSEWKVNSRLHSVGFMQQEAGGVAISNFKITENAWNSLLYSKDEEIVVAAGEENIWSPADETGAPMLRRQFDLGRKVASARLYATARGIYEFYVNGERLGGDWFNPGSADYNNRIFYSTYDLTPYLNEGGNVIGAQLGAGWYSDFMGYMTTWQDQFGTQLSLLAKIVITYDDGDKETIVSDDSWKVWDFGPITSDSFQNGEDYDARREVDGWCSAGFDDSQWAQASLFEAPADTVALQYYIGNPVRNHITLTAVSMSEPSEGVYVYDMGQNMVGVPSISLKGAEGQTVTFRFGEMIYPEQAPEDPLPPLTTEDYERLRGRVYNENYRSALATDHYVCRGDAEGEIFQPHFTFHGFRYIEIHGLDEPLPLSAVKGLVLESVGDCTSGYETSNENINRLYSNIVWGQRGNFLSIPTDCPQRDERMGWMGDAQIFARSATYNMRVDPFFRRWIFAVRDLQGDNGSYVDYAPYVAVPPAKANRGGGALGWMEAGIIVPWQIYQQYGDLSFIRDHYDSMLAYMQFLEKRAIGDIQPGEGYGDWVAVEHTNSPLTNTAYYGYDAMLMSKIARALGRDEDAERFSSLYDRIKVAFNREFVDGEGYTKTTDNVPPYNEWIAGGSDREHVARTQTSYVVPLQAGLFDDNNKPLALKHLVEDIEAHGNTITTGFIGTPYITLVLSENGYDDIAYTLFEQTEYPSWLYPVLQGATTIWERWNSYTIKRGFGTVDMNSFNHYSLGAIEEWMMVHSLGIQRDEENPGYKHIILQPKVGGTLDFCDGHYDSVLGTIASGWKKNPRGGYSYSATVPANTTATLHLRVPEGCDVKVARGGKHAVLAPEQCDGEKAYLLPAGSYRFEVK